MDMTSLYNALMENYNAVMCRHNKQTFCAIPFVNEDGETAYLKVAVSEAMMKPTKTNPAFDVEACQQEYAEFAKAQEERASKPKAVKGVNAEAEAKRMAQNEAMTQFFANEAEDGKAYTATELFELLPTGTFATIMEVGSTAKRIAENGIFTISVDGKKKAYTKA